MKKPILILLFIALAGSIQASEDSNLKSIMVDLGNNLHKAQVAATINDSKAMEEAGLAIANHPKIAKKDIKRIKSILKSELPKFKAWDIQVHEAGLKLAEAARKGDKTMQKKAYQRMEQGCIGCHNNYRQRLAR